jgi:uncharacterized protein YdhG (YjbR/CyaY superfamily)
VPESVAYTVANVGVQAAASILSYGTSTYFQEIASTYEAGVNAKAKALGITPEEVIESGQDGRELAETVSLIKAGLERTGAGLISQSIAKTGGYKAVRDAVIGILGKSAWSKAAGKTAGLAFTTLGEGVTGGLQEISSVLQEGNMGGKGLVDSFEGQGGRIMNAAGNEAIGGAGATVMGQLSNRAQRAFGPPTSSFFKKKSPAPVEPEKQPEAEAPQVSPNQTNRDSVVESIQQRGIINIDEQNPLNFVPEIVFPVLFDP